MKSVMNLSIAFLLGLANFAQADELSKYLWEKRPVLVFADNKDDENYKKQMQTFVLHYNDFLERDIVVFAETVPSENYPLRQKYKPKGFTFILIGKDGGVKLRSGKPVSISKLTGLIDAMPMRRQEIQK